MIETSFFAAQAEGREFSLQESLELLVYYKVLIKSHGPHSKDGIFYRKLYQKLYEEKYSSIRKQYHDLYIHGKIGQEKIVKDLLPLFPSKLKLFGVFGIQAPEDKDSPQVNITKEYSKGLTAGKKEVSFDPFSVERDLKIDVDDTEIDVVELAESMGLSVENTIYILPELGIDAVVVLKIKKDILPIDKMKRFSNVKADVEWVPVSLHLLEDLKKADEDLAKQVYSLLIAWEKINEKKVKKDGTLTSSNEL